MKHIFFGVTIFFLAIYAVPSTLAANTGIINTKHNLSVSGPGPIKALTETRVCVFCHTPHNATPSTPLWNRDLEPTNYNTYQSSTLTATIPQPTGPTRLCLSCHDGTIALGNVLGGENIQLTQELTGRASLLGTDISDDHPVSFPYHDSLPNSELRPSPPPELLTYEGGIIHCSTCHDPHDDSFGMFMAVDNSYSGLCVKCHLLDDWGNSSHSTSNKTWNFGSPNPWPLNDRLQPANQRHTVAENGCQNCHTPHNAQGKIRLMNYQKEEENCYPCHNGNVAWMNIKATMNKFSAHRVADTTNVHDTTESPTFLSGHVECVDCHNPHVANSISPAQPPQVSGKLTKVSGVTRYGSGISSASYEYEICFKCHGDTSTAISSVNRYDNQTNTRLEFDPINLSYHPVIDIGKNQADMPSLPSTYLPSMNASSMIYCTDCHDSNTSTAVNGPGPKGPHGSQFTPILRERYITTQGVLESYSNYALCYRCHDRLSILNDESFQRALAGGGGHNNHLNGHGQGTASAATCSVCHDPHGTNNFHLINFDSNVVSPATGNPAPTFVDLGSRSGFCILICHGITHDFTNSAYP